jgi:hypothetical protein
VLRSATACSRVHDIGRSTSEWFDRRHLHVLPAALLPSNAPMLAPCCSGPLLLCAPDALAPCGTCPTLHWAPAVQAPCCTGPMLYCLRAALPPCGTASLLYWPPAVPPLCCTGPLLYRLPAALALCCTGPTAVAPAHLQPCVALPVVTDWVLGALQCVLAAVNAVCGPEHNAEPTTPQLLDLLELRAAAAHPHTDTQTWI